jgi:hypothetical protein
LLKTTHSIIKENERSADLMRVQLHQVICECGWESNWYLDVNQVKLEYDDHSNNK